MRLIVFLRRMAFYIRESWRVENDMERFFCEAHPWGIGGVGNHRRKLTYRRVAWWRKLPANVRAAWRDAGGE